MKKYFLNAFALKGLEHTVQPLQGKTVSVMYPSKVNKNGITCEDR